MNHVAVLSVSNSHKCFCLVQKESNVAQAESVLVSHSMLMAIWTFLKTYQYSFLEPPHTGWMKTRGNYALTVCNPEGDIRATLSEGSRGKSSPCLFQLLMAVEAPDQWPHHVYPASVTTLPPPLLGACRPLCLLV